MGRGRSIGPIMTGGGGGSNINVKDSVDVWSYRHRQGNEPFVDEINTAARDMQTDFPDMMESTTSIEAATLGGADRDHTLGFYDLSTGSVSLNTNFTDVEKMNRVYDSCGSFHPSRGDKTGTAAVAYHELGHALTDHIAKKYGLDMGSAAYNIIESAYRSQGGKAKGVPKKWAKQISGYAQHDAMETIAEAVADYYCNGTKAHKNSLAIMDELRRLNGAR